MRLPYCWKCGAGVPEDAEFCPVCGTRVAPPVAERERRRPIIPLAIAIPLIVIIVIAAVAVTVVFLPVRSVDISESRDVPYQAGVDRVNIDFTADIARVNVAFEHPIDKLVTLDVSATGRVGVLVSPDVLDLTFDYTFEGNVLTVTADVDMVGPWPVPSWLHVTCDLRVDPSMNASLDVKTSTGGIVMDTRAGVVLNSLSLEAITGGVEANLVEGVVVAGDVSVKTITGGVAFSWDNVIVTKDVLVNAKTTTGGVDVDIRQYEELLGSVTLNAEATTGGVDFAIEIRGDVGARIESSVTTGGIDVEKQVNFSGTESLLRSENYPASSNFDVSLETTTGGVDVEAEYTP